MEKYMITKKAGTFLLCILSVFFLYGCGSGRTDDRSVPDSLPPASVQETENTSGTLLPGDDPGEAPEEDSFPKPNADAPVAEGDKYSGLQIAQKTLVIPGITKDYDLLFLSDTHMIVLDGTEDTQVTDNALPRTGLFKDSEGRDSYENFPVWMEYANETGMDMVLLGGDIIDFPSGANIAFLAQNLETLKMPYCYTLGNHDWTYPWEYMTETGRQQYRPLFHSFTQENPAASVTEYEELVILCVDNSSNQVDADALSVTTEALSMGKPVIVLLHVPFSTKTLLGQAAAMWNSPVSIGMADQGGIFPDANTAAFQEQILGENSPVVCILAGHVHFSDESMLTDSVVQLVAGAGYGNEGIALHIQGGDSDLP